MWKKDVLSSTKDLRYKNQMLSLSINAKEKQDPQQAGKVNVEEGKSKIILSMKVSIPELSLKSLECLHGIQYLSHFFIEIYILINQFSNSFNLNNLSQVIYNIYHLLFQKNKIQLSK